jgi:hypothetical protein
MNINQMIGEFISLQEQWEEDPERFDWSALQALAQHGALAYNEGAGPSFHSLMLDGPTHGEFHERFLAYSLASGFDPFKQVRMNSGSRAMPVISHESLAAAALENPYSARMRTALMEVARQRFSAQGFAATMPEEDLASLIKNSHESIPHEILAQLAPSLAAALTL